MIPNKRFLEETFKKLDNSDLQGISLTRLEHIFRNEVCFISYTLAHMKKGHFIYRARLNKKCEDGSPILFNSENEISYRTDLQNIKECGRANIPGQSMFYGSYDSESIETTRITNFFEIDELRNINNTSEELYLTIGKWEIKEDFVVLEIVFNNESIANNPDVKRSYENQLSNFSKSYPNNIEEIQLILEFYSNQFAKKVERKRSDDYKISALYTFVALTTKQSQLKKIDGSSSEPIWGVVYPSVQTEFKGNNIALIPDAVENYLELNAVGMFSINTHNKHTLMDNAEIVVDLGPYNSKFTWAKQKGLSEKEINSILMRK
jgi:hypothetical protein